MNSFAIKDDTKGNGTGGYNDCWVFRVMSDAAEKWCDFDVRRPMMSGKTASEVVAPPTSRIIERKLNDGGKGIISPSIFSRFFACFVIDQ
ncbi:MAG: hypothetical protein CL912_29025 [Deltaproteobacteria bacterium]|nr:hypothetical protein [Deltaproteobacteria bacterium]